jgi:hypothetical protein
VMFRHIRWWNCCLNHLSWRSSYFITFSKSTVKTNGQHCHITLCSANEPLRRTDNTATLHYVQQINR